MSWSACELSVGNQFSMWATQTDDVNKVSSFKTIIASLNSELFHPSFPFPKAIFSVPTLTNTDALLLQALQSKSK